MPEETWYQILDFFAKQKNIERLRRIDPLFGFDVKEFDLETEKNAFNSLFREVKHNLFEEKLDEETSKFFCNHLTNIFLDADKKVEIIALQ